MAQKISKSQLKARMLEIFRNIEATGEEVIVTNRGKSVLRIEAIKNKKSVADLFADIQGQVVYHEDIDTHTVEEWSDI